MNKKGQTDLIGNIISTIPKPVLFLFFIMLLTFFVLLLSPLFNASGIFCDSSGQIVKVDSKESSFFERIGLMFSLPSASQEVGQISPNTAFETCAYTINDSLRYNNDKKCVSCTEIDKEAISLTLSFISESTDFCIGDAYSIAIENISWWKRSTCRSYLCKIPDGYYFEFDTGTYQCIDGLCDNNTYFVSERDEKLNELGSYPYYTGDENNVFKFSCTQSLRVQPTIKGVPVFRVNFWLMITLISLLLWGIMKFRKK